MQARVAEVPAALKAGWLAGLRNEKGSDMTVCRDLILASEYVNAAPNMNVRLVVNMHVCESRIFRSTSSVCSSARSLVC